MLTQLNDNASTHDSWIVDQLIRIRSLEREVSQGLRQGSGGFADPALCAQVAELSMQIDLLDFALDGNPPPASAWLTRERDVA